MALKANPTILEVLASEKESWADAEGNELRNLFPAFLSRKRILDAFHGYSHQQRHKLEMAKLESGESEEKENRRRKSLTARLRILWNGADLLRTGKLTVRIADVPVIGEQCRRAKFGDMTNEEGAEIAEALKADLDAAYAESRLPMEPDVDAVNEFLVRVRRNHLAAGGIERVDTWEPPEQHRYTPVEVLKIDGRTLNALINNDIGSVEELVTRTAFELQEMKGFGKKSIEDVIAALATTGKYLKAA